MLDSTRRKFIAGAGALFALSGTAHAQELPPKNESQKETSEASATTQSEVTKEKQEQEQKQPDGPHLNDSGAGVFPEGSSSIVEDVTRSSDGIRMTLFFPADQSNAPNHDQGSAMRPSGSRGNGNGNRGLLGEKNQGQGRGRGQQGTPASGIRNGQGQQQGPGEVQTPDGASSGVMGFGANGSEAAQSGNETSTNGSNTSR